MSDRKFNLDTIALRNLQFRCIIGLYPRERVEAQPLELDLELDLLTDRAVAFHCLEETIDYSALFEELRFLLEHSHFDLLETAGHAICHFVLGFQPLDRRRSQVEQVRLVLRKPKALKGSAYPELIMKRHRAQLVHRTTNSPTQKYLHENANCTLLQLDLNPGDQVKLTKPDAAQCFIMSWSELEIVGGELPVPAGYAYQLDDLSIVRSSAEQGASLFCVLRWMNNGHSRENFFHLHT